MAKLANALQVSPADLLSGAVDSLKRKPVQQSVMSKRDQRQPTVTSEDTPGWAYWGGVVDNAHNAAKRSDPQELADVQMMLERALDAVIKARRVISSEQENGLPAAASA